MDQHADHPWFREELLEQRARHRRWLYGLRWLRDPEEDAALPETDADPVLLEVRWRQAIDAACTQEWREYLDERVAAATADQVDRFYQRTAVAMSWGQFMASMGQVISDARTEARPPKTERNAEEEVATLRSALRLAEQLAAKADQALGRPA